MRLMTSPVLRPMRASSKWSLEGLDASQMTALEGIPGLYLGDGQAQGYVDAVAIACWRVGIQAPAKFEPTTMVPPVGLRDYQQTGVQTLHAITAKMGGALLADDMGLGKTRQAIAFAGLYPAMRVMVVCPAFVRETWRDELTKWGGGSAAILGPKSAPSKAAKAEWDKAPTAHWVVASYEGAAQAMSAAFQNSSPDILIMDEAQLVRGRHAKRAADVQEIATLATYKVALTGTPIWSRPRDLYKILRILFGKAFGGAGDFDIAYAGGRTNEWGGWENKGATNTEELKSRLAYYMIRRERHEVLKELPPLTRQVIWCDPDERASGAFIRAMASRQPGQTQDALRATLESKMPVAVEYARAARRFLLYTWLKEHARKFAHDLNTKHDTPCVCITGDMPALKRQEQVRLAQANGWGIVATIDSLYAGVNCQGVASIGIMHSLDYVPIKMAQAEARIHRMGQKDAVTWIYLACKDSMDELVVKTVVNKLDQLRAVMGGKDNVGMRNLLDDTVGAGDEKAALKALYDSL